METNTWESERFNNKQSTENIFLSVLSRNVKTTWVKLVVALKTINSHYFQRASGKKKHKKEYILTKYVNRWAIGKKNIDSQ